MNKINFKEYFKNIFYKEPKYNYEVVFANPLKRFAAYLLDFFLVSMFIMLILYFAFKKNLQEFKNYKSLATSKEGTEIQFTIDTNNNISDLSIANDNLDNIKISNKNQVINTQEEFLKMLMQNKLYIYIVFFIPIVYNIIFLLTKKQATIGQQLFNLTVIKRDNNKIRFNDAINRSCLFALSKMPIIALFTIVLPVFLTKEKTTIYDFLSGTRVIEIK